MYSINIKTIKNCIFTHLIGRFHASICALQLLTNSLVRSLNLGMQAIRTYGACSVHNITAMVISIHNISDCATKIIHVCKHKMALDQN